jgi:glycosyltransferase involved in cell wall biosynthesis
MVDAAARDHDVYLVVVPVRGRLPVDPVVGPGVVASYLPDLLAPGDRSFLVKLVADPVWRDRLEALQPWPPELALAPPTMTVGIVEWLGPRPIAAVLACRLVLAPLGLALAEHAGVPLMVDSDDADVRYLADRGEADAAARWDRVAQVCLPQASMVTLAAPSDADWLGSRYGIMDRVRVVPNGVRLTPEDEVPPGLGRLLFVGNMTYQPNAEGLKWFVSAVLPLLERHVSVDVVGDAPDDVRDLTSDRVRVHGWVSDVRPYYRESDVVIAPLWAGSGSRIKLLEAFVYGRPVVATSIAVAGIDAENGRHLRIADTPSEFAVAIDSALDSVESAPLVSAARQLMLRSYDGEMLRESTATLVSQLTRGEVAAP